MTVTLARSGADTSDWSIYPIQVTRIDANWLSEGI